MHRPCESLPVEARESPADPTPDGGTDSYGTSFICSEEEFQRVFAAYRHSVYSVARRVLIDKSLAEDVVQAVFFDFWNNQPAIPRTEIIGWLRAVARNKSISHNRALWKRREGHITVDLPGAPLKEPMLLLNGVPSLDRQMLVLRYVVGLNSTEIAGATGVRPATVRARLFRARGKLKKLLSVRNTSQGSERLGLGGDRGAAGLIPDDSIG